MRRSQALSLPNILTYGRLAAIPAVVALLFWPEDRWSRWIALAIYIAAAVTDYLDGYFARAYAQQSALGRMLDPIADKLLVSACLLMLVADETIRHSALWAAIVILSREILVSGLREFLIAGPAGETVLPGTILIGTGLLWVAAVLTIYTGWDYLKAGLRHVMEER
jgi:cardiolipin synthase (CMP-forming)